MADVFSRGGSTAPFFRFPIGGWFKTPNKPFSVTNAPIGRDMDGRITSLQWKGKTYQLDLDSNGYVVGIATQ